MKNKKLLIPILCVITSACIIGVLVFIIIGKTKQTMEEIERKRILFEETGIEAKGNVIISKYAGFSNSDGANHNYEIIFGEDEYDFIMNKFYAYVNDDEPHPEFEDIMNNAVNGWGVPKGYYWMDPQKESIVWWYWRIDSARVVVTRDYSNQYHAYIEWILENSSNMYK